MPNRMLRNLSLYNGFRDSPVRPTFRWGVREPATARVDTPDLKGRAYWLSKFLHMRREKFPEPPEPWVLLQVPAHVAERARDVLDVHGIAASGGLIPERAERLQVALQRHEIEAAAEFDVHAGDAFQREE